MAKYYWLRLDKDFFRQKEIKKLRKIAGGDTYTIIYQKMLLLSLQEEGKLFFDGIEDDFANEIALEIDEEVDNVKITILFLMKNHLLEEVSSDECFLSAVPQMIGKESDSASRVRKYRENKKLLAEKNLKALHCNKSNVTCNTEIEIEKEIELEKDIDIELTKNDLSFENVWAMYPNKRGKGSIKPTRIGILSKIGFDKIKIAIERYLKDVELRRVDFPDLAYKYGSTFFNSGYVDYVDDDFEYYKPIKANTKVKANYDQRDYTRNQLDNLTSCEMEDF